MKTSTMKSEEKNIYQTPASFLFLLEFLPFFLYSSRLKKIWIPEKIQLCSVVPAQCTPPHAIFWRICIFPHTSESEALISDCVEKYHFNIALGGVQERQNILFLETLFLPNWIFTRYGCCNASQWPGARCQKLKSRREREIWNPYLEFREEKREMSRSVFSIEKRTRIFGKKSRNLQFSPIREENENFF